MKKFILIVSIIFFGTINLKAQSSNSNGSALANKIAQKMKDSLQLSGYQKANIQTINLELHHEKMAARRESISRDSLSKKIQKIENSRDTLYRSVLSKSQYDLYKKKKRNLVNNN